MFIGAIALNGYLYFVRLEAQQAQATTRKREQRRLTTNYTQFLWAIKKDERRMNIALIDRMRCSPFFGQKRGLFKVHF
jgi:hypothetical protein